MTGRYVVTRSFAAGTDISHFRAFKTPEDALGYEGRPDRSRAGRALEYCLVPTVVGIKGACTGGGAAIAACCDLRVAAGNSKFGFPVARTLGNCISMGNFARFAAPGRRRPRQGHDLPRQASSLAQEALAIGLITELVEDPNQVMARAEEVTRLVASHAPLTLKATKEALLRPRPTIPRGQGDDLILMCYMSEDFRECMDAFLSKRPPN